MKILRIIARLNMGGPARHVIVLDAGLRARGHQTLLIYGQIGDGEASLEHLVTDNGVPALRTPHLGRRISAWSDLRAFVALVRAVFRESPDVVHTHTAKAGALGRLAALLFNATRPRQRRCLVVHTFHGHVLTGYFSPIVNRALVVAERALARITDRIVTISPSQHRDIVERFAISSDAKTATIALGLQLDELLRLPRAAAPSFRADLGVDPGNVVVGYVGRMVAIKDLATLIRAFALALAKNPRLRLVLAGDGPVRATLGAVVEELGIGGKVHLLGWTEDLPRLYATIDICALTSLNEGTPVALIEAMAAGKATVAVAVGGVSDVVEHEVTGLLVRAGDVDALAGALLRVASDSDLRDRMGDAGRRRAAARYSAVRLVDDIEELYLTGLGAKRGRAHAPRGES